MISDHFVVRERPKDEVNLCVGSDDRNFRTMRFGVRPLSEFKNDEVVKQLYDYSCGSAALATVLNYGLGEDLDERQIIQGLMRHGDQEKISKRRAFSLLDMKSFVKVLGYKGVGYQAEIEDLKTLKEPGIIPVEIYGYHHFVVLKGVIDNHVFIADPSRGNISFEIGQFEAIWPRKIVFVIYPADGEMEWNALALGDEDLRYVDFDTTRKCLFDQTPAFTNTVERELMEEAGGVPFYKAR